MRTTNMAIRCVKKKRAMETPLREARVAGPQLRLETGRGSINVRKASGEETTIVPGHSERAESAESA